MCTKITINEDLFHYKWNTKNVTLSFSSFIYLFIYYTSEKIAVSNNSFRGVKSENTNNIII